MSPCPRGDPIQPGCRVTLKTVSPLPKYNREKTVLTVGSNLYNPDLERMLVGMCAGQSGRIEIQGKTVSFWILQAERKAYPPPHRRDGPLPSSWRGFLRCNSTGTIWQKKAAAGICPAAL